MDDRGELRAARDLRAPIAEGQDAVHEWFGLTYSNYLVLHRSLLQSMPGEWQARFVVCLRELEAAFAHVEQASEFRVHAVNSRGRYVADPVPHYNRGRTCVEPVLLSALEEKGKL